MVFILRFFVCLLNSSAISTSASEVRKQKLAIWPEWTENDINAEKWEVVSKVKESKAKPTSAIVSHKHARFVTT